MRCVILVLSRKYGEEILIGDNIRIVVVDIDRGKVRLGIECPRDVPIYRAEIAPVVVKPAPAKVRKPEEGFAEGIL